MDIPELGDFSETYLYEELLGCDLSTIIRSQEPLRAVQTECIVYQILSGLKYIHSANGLHRDLKPSNILVNANCELKICDFGLARGFSTKRKENVGYMTEYVATRWYRAPETMLGFHTYTKAIDMWSVGCIFAELLGRRPLFRGRDNVDQINQILHYIGTPKEETLARIGSPRVQENVRNIPPRPRIPLGILFPHSSPLALNLLSRMLAFDPESRISAGEALKDAYLQSWHNPSAEPDCPTTFDIHFEVVEDLEEIRGMIFDEVMQVRDVRQQSQATASTQPPDELLINIPEQDGSWKHEEPKPQDAFSFGGSHSSDLESLLQQGMDVK